MPLKVVTGRLDLLPTSIVCNLHDGEQIIVCTIARQLLRDLGGYHLGRAIPEEAVFSEFLSEIERIASAKFDTQRLDENGELSIGSADLARYGFGSLHE